MNTKADAQAGDKLDTVKWLVAGLLVAGGLAVFYFSPEVAVWLKALAVLATTGMAVFVASRTGKGRQAWGFIQDTHIEVRKVVWPSRQETIQTTGIVIAMVLVIALMIWAVDSILFWIVQTLTS
jgi:preprotein translocase subunit SecE